MIDDSIRYKILRLLDEHPELSQREIAERVGFSLGKTNYCLNALIDKGWIKLRNFRNSRNKRCYLYQLTPTGLAEKVRVTQRFLSRKLREYEEMADEIERMRQELKSTRREGVNETQ